MLTLKGKYNEAVVFTDNIDSAAVAQIIDLCNRDEFGGSKIRIMPDVHAGAGCTIGTTMTLTGKVVPNHVGVDIGCGVMAAVLEETEIDFAMLDEVIRRRIPYGRDVHAVSQSATVEEELGKLRCRDQVNLERAALSLGSLGGGNHYIEVDRGSDGALYLCVHTGSRHIGKQVAEYYQKVAEKSCKSVDASAIIQRLKAEGKTGEIEKTLKEAKKKIPAGMEYLSGADFDDYIHDMAIMQRYATENRAAIVDIIVRAMGFAVRRQISSTHNYIDIQNMILRKGAISARAGEEVIIPLNMRDGAIIAIGRGNPDWNYSAPHGAGRLYSRRQAKEGLTIDAFRVAMDGIWTSCVSEATLDESPMAYKPAHEILACINETVEVVDVVKPIYNFKASE